MTQHDLTGTWRGHYEQNGQRRGISMRVLQRGALLIGAMHDDETMWVTKEELQPVDHDEVGIGPVAVDLLTVLPAESTIEGEVDGARVTFEKRYRGKHTFTVFFDHSALHPGAEGQASANAEIESHRVVYDGQIDATGEVLRGTWRIPVATVAFEDGDVDPDDAVQSRIVGENEALLGEDCGEFELRRE